MLQLETYEFRKQRRLIITWGISFLILFPLLIFSGFLMRLGQGELIKLLLSDFYSLLTFHGLMMASVFYSFAFAALWYLIGTRVVKLDNKTGYIVYITMLIGVGGISVGTLIGKFGTGWYLLYPLPFVGITWTHWPIGVCIMSLLIWCLGWLIGIFHLLYALSKKFGGFTNLMGWKYLRKEKELKELPPLVLVATASLLPGVFAFFAGMIMLILYLLQFFESLLAFDSLLLKNMTFFNSHTLVHITLYCAVGWVYALLPEYTGCKWRTNKALVYSWNATLFLTLISYLHHLYMDFAQPIVLQFIGQAASYLSVIPAAAITICGIIAQVSSSKIKWSIVPLSLLSGIAGWIIGGFTAALSSVIPLNTALHNTLWIQGQLHTIMLLGIGLLIFAFLFYIFPVVNKRLEKIAKAGFWLFVTGGIGFVLAFFLGGLKSIPRSFARYSGIDIEIMHNSGVSLARMSVWFIGLLFSGLIVMYISIIGKFFKKGKLNI